MRFDPAVEPLGILTENHRVDIVAVVEGVAGKGLARPQVGMEMEFLPQPDDGAEIDQTLAL